MREGSVATQGDKSYVTPLHMAAWYGNKRSIEFILELVDASDTAVNAKDKSDRVPLHFAVWCSCYTWICYITNLPYFHRHVLDM